MLWRPTWDTPPSQQPCRHFPLGGQDILKSIRLGSDLRLQSPYLSVSRIQPTHTALPATRAAPVQKRTLCLSEPVLPLPPLIDVLVTSTRETAPKQSARPLAHDDTLRPLDHPSASPRCLLSTALRRRSLRSLLQLRGPMRRLHNGYVNVAFRAKSCHAFSPILSCAPYTALKRPFVFPGMAICRLSPA